MDVSFFINDTATTEIYTLSLHDALPISGGSWQRPCRSSFRQLDPEPAPPPGGRFDADAAAHPLHPFPDDGQRSEEHTSELQSRQYLVCRLLLEKQTAASAARLRSIHDAL